MQQDLKRSFSVYPTFTVVLVIVLVTALSRIMTFGNPTAHIDDQFYLLVGHSLLNGELPYVDVWDRKPIGIFLVYAGAAALGPNGVIQYQLVAALFVFATSLSIYSLARHFTTQMGALLGSLFYPIMIAQLGGDGGQVPVFQNLFMAVAGLLIFKTTMREAPPSLWTGGLAIGLIGLSLTIKQTAVFEGVFFALWFLFFQYKHVRRINRLALTSMLFMAIAAAPTALSYLIYYELGHFDEMWQATFSSVLRKLPVTLDERLFMLPYFIRILVAPLLIAVFSIYKMTRHSGLKSPANFLTLWLIAAAVSFFAIPNFFFHYALPFVVPLSIALAFGFGLVPWGKVMFAGVAVAEILTLVRPPFFMSPYRSDYPKLLSAVRSELGDGCLYVHYGQPQLYTDTGACKVTKFVFPDHLETAIESEALPVAPDLEMERFFRENPPQVVVTGARGFMQRNAVSEATLQYYLNCQYRRGPRVQQGKRDFLQLWVLRRPSSCQRNSRSAA